jgi:hypothetical protein
MGRKRHVYRITVGKLEKGDCVGDVGIDVRLTLELVLTK